MAPRQQGKGASPAAAKAKPRSKGSIAYQDKYLKMAKTVKKVLDAPTTIWAAQPKTKPGPLVYTPLLGSTIADLIIEGKSIQRISKIEGMPSDVTMYKWIGDINHPFAKVYADAKQLMVARFEEEIQDIADTPCIGSTTVERSGPDGDTTEVRKADMIQHRQLQIAVRQWSLGHLRPKKHGKQADPDAGAPNAQLTELLNAFRDRSKAIEDDD